MASAVGTRRAGRRFRLLFVFVVLAAIAAWLVGVQLQARANFHRGKDALDADDPQAARQYLDRCLVSWPRSSAAHFHAAQAARRCGDLTDAERHLAEAEKLGWDTGALQVERALALAQSGDLIESEDALKSALDNGHPDSAQICAVLLRAYVAEFRWADAEQCAEVWTNVKPQSAEAWHWLGQIFERLRRKKAAATAYQHAIDIEPNDRRARFDLARMLIETRQPGSAAEHLEWLTQTQPQDPAVETELAVCREQLGFADSATTILDKVIAEYPTEAKAYYHRGRIDLNRDRAASALPFLRRAVELDPSDPEALHSLVLCVQQVSPAEASAVEERWRRCDTDLRRVNELARLIALSPKNADLRCEMGELFMRNSRTADGLRWLASALRIRPEHIQSHRVLADYFEKSGQMEIASYHRSFCQLSILPGM